MNLSTNQEIWEDIFVNNDWGQYPSLALVRFIAKNFYSISNRTEIKILELGCGTGSNIWYLRREGFTTYAIDYFFTVFKRVTVKTFNVNNCIKIIIFKMQYLRDIVTYKEKRIFMQKL